MKIDGMTPKMVNTLCRKWKYPETEVVEKFVDVPDPDPEAEEGATIKEKKKVTIPNRQSKDDFVKMYTMSFLKNEYRLQERADDKKTSEKATDARVEKEIVLK